MRHPNSDLVGVKAYFISEDTLEALISSGWVQYCFFNTVWDVSNHSRRLYIEVDEATAKRLMDGTPEDVAELFKALNLALQEH